MPTDPLATYQSWFNLGSSSCKVTRSNLMVPPDDTRHAVFIARYEDSEENLQDTFLTENIDICFVIQDLGADTFNTASGPLYYEDRVGIQPVIIDKWASGGASYSLNAKLLRRRAENEIQRILRANLSSGSYGQPGGKTKSTERVGSSLLYGNVHQVRHREYVSNY